MNKNKPPVLYRKNPKRSFLAAIRQMALFLRTELKKHKNKATSKRFLKTSIHHVVDQVGKIIDFQVQNGKPGKKCTWNQPKNESSVKDQAVMKKGRRSSRRKVEKISVED